VVALIEPSVTLKVSKKPNKNRDERTKNKKTRKQKTKKGSRAQPEINTNNS
jgi:hypothetical protein